MNDKGIVISDTTAVSVSSTSEPCTGVINLTDKLYVSTTLTTADLLRIAMTPVTLKPVVVTNFDFTLCLQTMTELVKAVNRSHKKAYRMEPDNGMYAVTFFDVVPRVGGLAISYALMERKSPGAEPVLIATVAALRENAGYQFRSFNVHAAYRGWWRKVDLNPSFRKAASSKWVPFEE